MRSATIPLVRFHAAAAVRLAYRTAIPLVVALIVAAGVSSSPAAFLGELAAGLADPRRGLVVSTLLALASLSVASWAAPRTAYGVRSYLAHLPADSIAREGRFYYRWCSPRLPCS